MPIVVIQSRRIAKREILITGYNFSKQGFPVGSGIILKKIQQIFQNLWEYSTSNLGVYVIETPENVINYIETIVTIGERLQKSNSYHEIWLEGEGDRRRPEFVEAMPTGTVSMFFVRKGFGFILRWH